MLRILVLLSIFVGYSCGQADRKDAGHKTEAHKIESDSTLSIVPGKRIGKIALGSDATELEAILGAPDFSDAAMGKAWLTWYSDAKSTAKKHELNIFTSYRDAELTQKIVRQIRVTSPEFTVSGNGLSTASTLSEIKKQFELQLTAKDHSSVGGKGISLYEVPGIGLAFEYSNTQCIAILVTDPTVDATQYYRYFRPEITLEKRE